MAKKKSRPALSAIATASRTEATEAVYFARKCGLTPDEALRIMREAHEASGFKAAGIKKPKR
jgi:3-hydroxyisobutyrate dehydrogenase-like beta-hydroxyacid dehydrogenase